MPVGGCCISRVAVGWRFCARVTLFPVSLIPDFNSHFAAYSATTMSRDSWNGRNEFYHPSPSRFTISDNWLSPCLEKIQTTLWFGFERRVMSEEDVEWRPELCKWRLRDFRCLKAWQIYFDAIRTLIFQVYQVPTLFFACCNNPTY